MPLRHATETAVLFLLSIVIALTGVLTSTLPALPFGGFPWLLLTLATVAYPIVLMPLFRMRRADVPLRLMHWIPFMMLLLWGSIEALALSWPHLSVLQGVFTFGWTLPAVALSALLLILYCLRVIRRRVPRIAFLLLLFVPYIVLGTLSSVRTHWDGQLAAHLWKGSFWQVFGSGAVIPAGRRSLAEKRSSLGSLAVSQDSSEERWRSKIRASERRSERESARRSVALGAKSSSSTPAVVTPPSSVSPVWHQSSSVPTALPASGAGIEIIALSMVALYCAVLHDRTRKRITLASSVLSRVG